MNVAFGGTLVVDIPSQITNSLRHSRIDKKNDSVHPVHIEPGTKLASIFGRTKLGVNSSHHQAVAKVGRRLRISAHAPDGVVEAIETTDGTFTLAYRIKLSTHSSISTNTGGCIPARI